MSPAWLPACGVGNMLDQDSLDYFRRRERAERAAAKHAASEAARRVHQELAQSYAEMMLGTSNQIAR